MSRPDDIVGYTFRADLYCPYHIVAQLPTGPDEAFDGWALAPGVGMTVEENLNEIAYAFGFDRGDEASFDSGDFPKVVFRDALGDDDRCGECHTELEEVF